MKFSATKRFITYINLSKYSGDIMIKKTAFILLILLSTAFSRNAFREGDLLIQAAPVAGKRTTSDVYYGGQACANYFFNDIFALQMIAGGGKGWAEYSPGLILGPLGILLMKGESQDIRQFFGGLLMFASILENPAVHIPAGSHLTIAPSLHVIRVRWEEGHDAMIGGGAGLSLNVVPARHFTASIFGECGFKYEKGSPFGGKVGIRFGGVIPL